jgi:hypothetical protein
VGRTSVEAIGEAVEAVDEDLAVLGEVVVGEDPAALGEVAIAKPWRRTWRSGCVQHGPDGGR